MTRRRTILMDDEVDAKLVIRAEAEGLPPSLWIRHQVYKILGEGKRGPGRPPKDERAQVLDRLKDGPVKYEELIRSIDALRPAVVWAIRGLRDEGVVEGDEELRVKG